jgi:hypothetical protein
LVVKWHKVHGKISRNTKQFYNLQSRVDRSPISASMLHIAALKANSTALKVVRLTDRRVLFPFEGCPEIGPFPDRQSAVDAAQQYGEQLALGDLQIPES